MTGGAKRTAAGRPTAGEVREWLACVPDPEIPVLSVLDLGVVRDVQVHEGGVEVAISPTYVGCPATEVIERSIRAELERRGVGEITVRRVLSPPWTTDWLSEEGRRKLAAAGIAPPAGPAGKQSLLGRDLPVACPRCAATETSRVSEFGSTPCKATYKCDSCLEPFEYFKCI